MRDVGLRRLFSLGAIALSMAFVGKVNGSPVTLRVVTNTDTPSSYPGGQTNPMDPTTGDLRYCINYILNMQAQGISQDYNIFFDPSVSTIQLNGKLSMVNLIGSDTVVIGNSDTPVTIMGGSGTGGLFIRQGDVTLQNLNFKSCNATGGSGRDGGGGGMGSGGALFIDTANVTLNNVNFTSCTALSGLGGMGSGGGGGGLGGDGGASGGGPGGGGGGYHGNGGSNSGGGGGAGADGGDNLGGGGGAIIGTVGGSGGGSPVDAMSTAPYTFSGDPIPSLTFVVGGGGYGSQGNGTGGTGAGANNSGGVGGVDGNMSAAGGGGEGGTPIGGVPASGGGGSSSMTGDDGNASLLGGDGGSGGMVYMSEIGSFDGGSAGGGGGGYCGGGGGGGVGGGTSAPYNGGGGGGGGGIGGGGAGGFGTSGGAPSMTELGGGKGGVSSFGGGGGGGGPGGGGGGGGGPNDGLGSGGDGGDGGGGGGSFTGGAGGYGGGGGCGGEGGFGGGGGNSSGGAGFGGGGGSGSGAGFGGGGGGDSGVSGVGASPSASMQGGNGAAFGGAVFLGGSYGYSPTLTLIGNCSTLTNSASNNSGGGFAGGDDFFLYSDTTLNLAPGVGETISISRSIIDDSEQSIPMGSAWEPGAGTGANLQVTGAGTVILGGTNSYIGTTTVSSGTLSLSNATLYAGGAGMSGQVTVSSGAILKGTGTINAPTLVSGTLSPGNSIGTMNYSEPLTVLGTLSIEIAPTANDNSKISSTSTVDVTGGTIQIIADPGAYTVGSQYTLVTSTGVTGMASLLMPTNFAGALSYTLDNSILLTLLQVPAVSLQTFGLTGNSLKLANYLNALGDLGAPFSTLTGLSESDQAAALLTLSPSRAAFARYGNEQAAFSFSRLVTDRLSNARVLRKMEKLPIASLAAHSIDESELLAAAKGKASYGGAIRHVDKKPYNAWISGFGGLLYEKGSHQNPAFHATNGGLLAAIDKTFSKDAIVGGGLAYSYSQIHEASQLGKAHTQGGLVTLYGTWYFSDFFLDTSIWGGYLHTNNRRNIFYPGFDATATGSFNSGELNAHLELGYDWYHSQGTLEPFVACDFVCNWQGNYSEQGASPYNMHIKSNFASLLQTEVGFNGYYNKDFSTYWTFILRGKLSYVNQVPFHQSTLQANLIGATSSLSLVTSLRTQNLVSPALEIYFKHHRGFFVSLLYNGQFGKWFRNNELEAKLGLSF